MRYLEGDAVQAIIFTELASLSKAFKDTTQMKCNDGWFFRSVEDFEKDTGISYHKQKAAIEKLEDKKFIKTKIAGRPGKRFFKVCHEYVEATLFPQNVILASVDPEIQVSKKETFYRELNIGANKDFDTFKTKIDNMKKPFAVLLYTWGRLFQQYLEKTWEWTPLTLGKLRYWYNSENPEGQIDYSRLYEFFKSGLPINIAPEKYIDSWIAYDRSNFEKSPEQRVYDPRGYWK